MTETAVIAPFAPSDIAPDAAIRARFALTWADFALDVDLTFPAHGVTAFFGPSGSGKTSLLRCIAGLERAGCGLLAVRGEVWQDDARGIFVPTHRRALAYVFQDARLFPHLDVQKNLLYPLKRRSLPGSFCLDQVVAWLELDAG